MCQRSTTWPGVLPWASAISAIAGSSSTSPCASGLHASVTMPRSACSRRRPCCWQVGVQLDLVDGGRHAGLVDDPAQVRGLEVRHADGAREAGLLRLDQRLPGLDVAVLGRHRPVDQVEVDVLHLEPAEARLERAVACRSRGRRSRLGGDEELARQAGGVDGLADLGLVAVGLGGVDVAVAGLDRVGDVLDRVLGRHLEDAEPELGDRDVAGERRSWGSGGWKSCPSINRRAAGPNHRAPIDSLAMELRIAHAPSSPHRATGWRRWRVLRWRARARLPSGTGRPDRDDRPGGARLRRRRRRAVSSLRPARPRRSLRRGARLAGRRDAAARRAPVRLLGRRGGVRPRSGREHRRADRPPRRGRERRDGRVLGRRAGRDLRGRDRRPGPGGGRRARSSASSAWSCGRAASTTTRPAWASSGARRTR